jgi:hypothetical protein
MQSWLHLEDRPVTPLEKVEALYDELVRSYGDGSDREIRAASKLLMVALTKLKAHGGVGWRALVQDYLQILVEDPDRYAKMLESNRGEKRKE